MPTVTAADLINDAARANGKLGPGRTLSASEQGDALRIFQRMIDAWTTERLMVFSLSRDVYTLIPGQGVVSIGPYGDWIAARPLKVESLGLVLTGVQPNVETPIKLATEGEWQAIGVKDLTSPHPRVCSYNSGWPLAEFHFWPVPLEANDIAVYTWQQLASPAALESIVRFPPGYEQAIVDNLAVATCALFGRRPLPELVEAARESKARVKRSGHTSELMRCDSGLSAGAGGVGFESFYTGT